MGPLILDRLGSHYLHAGKVVAQIAQTCNGPVAGPSERI